ncbi:hypothetical protein EDB80DRAFT_874889 [Ilyonectria destructans]|nr:hypothetical protein EDB80DRAFT_874889 [Ilyonectria destructans]
MGGQIHNPTECSPLLLRGQPEQKEKQSCISSLLFRDPQFVVAAVLNQCWPTSVESIGMDAEAEWGMSLKEREIARLSFMTLTLAIAFFFVCKFAEEDDILLWAKFLMRFQSILKIYSKISQGLPREAASLYYSYRTDEVSALPDIALALAIMWLMLIEERLQRKIANESLQSYWYVALPIFGVGLLLMLVCITCSMLEFFRSSRFYKEYFLAFGCIVHRAFGVWPLAAHIFSSISREKRKDRGRTIGLFVCIVIALILTIVIAFVPWFHPYDPRNNQCLYLYLFFAAMAIILSVKRVWKLYLKQKLREWFAKYLGSTERTANIVEDELVLVTV